MTRLKNQPTILESGKGLSYSFSATYAYRTWKKVIAWVQVEDRYGTVNPAGKISGIELEAPVDLLATTNSSMNELEQDSQFIGLPEEFVIVTQQMVGGNLAFEWIKKPDTSVLGPQTAKVKVTNILGGYKNTIEVTIPITVREKGSVSVQAPEMLEFQDYQIQNSDTIVERKQDDWNLVVEDTRHPNNQENEGWSLTAKAENSVSGLEKYLVFIDEENQEYSLLEETLIFTSVLQQTENTLINWADNRGILLKIPKNNDLQPNQQYQTTITWNINEGP
ncbi:hypothetical protein CMALT430_110093 [Carnobacterium maltaromaticum]|uniref:hypothetical protein n=1 Tax=Carnobacterium maltaromaticum TaxID=2751 RepID=UPI00191BA995|nr:hypothetical protein [Carnobacterium maltaromaticum]CAD5896746.1 hypothetical protein CMALT430_110093 [Carnobacterium maltaromaticum]